MAAPRTPAEAPAADGTFDLLVALEHARLVQGLLAGWDARDVVATPSADLGLARLVGRLPGRGAPGGSPRGTSAGAPAADPTVAVLARLRAHCADRYAGWVPTLGRNRLVGHVTGGGGTVSHGGGPAPVPARPPARGLAARGVAPGAGAGLTVGVLDTALVPHPALTGAVLGRVPEDVVAPGTAHRTARPHAAGHATFVAGLVLRQAPGATVRVRRVLDDEGRALSWDVANAVVALGRSGVQVLNLSLVCTTEDGRPPLGLAAAVDRLDPDVLVVACAGNHGAAGDGDGDGPVGGPGGPGGPPPASDARRRPAWPAALDDVVAVGAARRPAARRGPGGGRGAPVPSPFTPPDAPWIDVLADGEDLVSTYLSGPDPAGGAPFRGWARWSGTSFSAALVAGRVAARAAELGVPPRAALADLLAGAAVDGTGPEQGVPAPPFLALG
ncbi:S8/S53 family peptidase [Cellulomonas endophytica]|uniref:S8/S53 family peptidase n=1 Tax=Cellulomonas endophytica TaxID=2494735 RepID=UPI001010A580|nr:S8/S53 family peptidase [Cellulomonas endophytica]